MNQQPRVWDLFVRIFHWSVVLGFLLNYAILDDDEPPHEWVGYFILALVALRVLWGFVGPPNARFSDFFPTPQRVKSHLAELLSFRVQPHDGHNPLGGLMILALLSLLVLTGFSGWLTTNSGEWAEDIHEFCANLTFLLVLIHVAVVVIFSRFGSRNLIKQMITGRREER